MTDNKVKLILDEIAATVRESAIDHDCSTLSETVNETDVILTKIDSLRTNIDRPPKCFGTPNVTLRPGIMLYVRFSCYPCSHLKRCMDIYKEVYPEKMEIQPRG